MYKPKLKILVKSEWMQNRVNQLILVEILLLNKRMDPLFELVMIT